jgi:membrane-bound metal-dependent hydrolase YbcI (DUF457 family)
MFIGHFAVGFAAKRIVPQVSLAVLFVAVQFADLLWPFLLALGFEQVAIDPGNTSVTPLDFISYPYSHSLVFAIAWGLLFAFAYEKLSHTRGVFFVLAALVVSHWVLDFVTHRPDLPLYPGGARYGLGMWKSLPLTAVVETAMYAIGVFVYATSTRPRDAIGRWGFWAFVVFLLVVYAGNLMGPPPPSVPAIYLLGMVGSIVLLAWSWWVDEHRTAAGVAQSQKPKA